MEEQHTPRREPRPLPAVSASITAAAAELGIEPPSPEQIAGIQGATVVLPPDSAASAGARGVYDNIEHNTMLRDAGYVELGVDPADPGAEVEVPPEGGNGGNGGTATAPVNTTVPAVTQAGATLTCTQGEWSGEPTSYAYAWQVNGTAVGTDAATYDVQAADVGGTATCTVTATNAAGSAAAPPSTGVVVA
jgi:hypothetical protein